MVGIIAQLRCLAAQAAADHGERPAGRTIHPDHTLDDSGRPEIFWPPLNEKSEPPRYPAHKEAPSGYAAFFVKLCALGAVVV
jgi:hypothetical protein